MVNGNALLDWNAYQVFFSSFVCNFIFKSHTKSLMDFCRKICWKAQWLCWMPYLMVMHYWIECILFAAIIFQSHTYAIWTFVEDSAPRHNWFMLMPWLMVMHFWIEMHIVCSSISSNLIFIAIWTFVEEGCWKAQLIMLMPCG